MPLKVGERVSLRSISHHPQVVQVRVPHIPWRAKHEGVQHQAFNPLLPSPLVSPFGSPVHVPALPFPASSCFWPTPVPLQVGQGCFSDLCYDPPQFFSSPSFTVTPSIPAPLTTQPTVTLAAQPDAPATPAVRLPLPMQVDPANVPLLPTAEVTPAHSLQPLPSPPTIALRQPPLVSSLPNSFICPRFPCRLVFINTMYLQLLKKLSQCFKLLERVTWHKSNKLWNILKIINIIVQHLSFQKCLR